MAHNLNYKNLVASVQISDQVQNWRQLVSALKEWTYSLKSVVKTSPIFKVTYLFLHISLRLKIAVFWVMAPFSLIEICQHPEKLVTSTFIFNRLH
jgi:hypothetical protein